MRYMVLQSLLSKSFTCSQREICLVAPLFQGVYSGLGWLSPDRIFLKVNAPQVVFEALIIPSYGRAAPIVHTPAQGRLAVWLPGQSSLQRINGGSQEVYFMGWCLESKSGRHAVDGLPFVISSMVLFYQGRFLGIWVLKKCKNVKYLAIGPTTVQ